MDVECSYLSLQRVVMSSTLCSCTERNALANLSALVPGEPHEEPSLLTEVHLQAPVVTVVHEQ